MMRTVEFILSNFWTFTGAVVFVLVVASAISMVLGVTIAAIRGTAVSISSPLIDFEIEGRK